MLPRRCRSRTVVMSWRPDGSSRKGRPKPCSRAPTFRKPPSGSESIDRQGARRWMKPRALASLTIVALSLAGCTVGVSTPVHSMGVIKRGVDLPLSGDDAPDGLPTKNAIDLAIKQAGRVCGPTRHPDACFDLQQLTYDDGSQGIHDPAKGAKNVQLLVEDARVLAMVGPLYDSLAKSELPVANPVELAMVSPGTTNECLTQEPPDGHCQGLSARLRPRSPNNFFRVVTTQLVEGAAGADLAFKALGKKRAFVINDQTTFGSGIAAAFVARFVRDGGTVLDPSDLGAFDANQPPAFGSRVERAAELGADVVYFAGAGGGAAGGLRGRVAARRRRYGARWRRGCPRCR